jgi:ATP-dependent DNA ligase
MLIERMRRRLAADTKFIEPCLPVSGRQAPSGANWIHEIKHDGYRLMARSRRDPVGIRLITRRDNDWTTRYPLVVEAVSQGAVLPDRWGGGVL